MNPKRIWTEHDIETLRRITLDEGVSSVDAAVRFGVSAQHIRIKRVEFGIVPKGWRGGPIAEAQSVEESPPTLCRKQNWWPLPAGSPVSWQAISDQPWPGP